MTQLENYPILCFPIRGTQISTAWSLTIGRMWKQQYMNTLRTECATGRDLLNALLVQCEFIYSGLQFPLGVCLSWDSIVQSDSDCSSTACHGKGRCLVG